MSSSSTDAQPDQTIWVVLILRIANNPEVMTSTDLCEALAEFFDRATEVTLALPQKRYRLSVRSSNFRYGVRSLGLHCDDELVLSVQSSQDINRLGTNLATWRTIVNLSGGQELPELACQLLSQRQSSQVISMPLNHTIEQKISSAAFNESDELQYVARVAGEARAASPVPDDAETVWARLASLLDPSYSPR